MLQGKRPVEEGRAARADVEVARRRRGEAHAQRPIGHAGRLVAAYSASSHDAAPIGADRPGKPRVHHCVITAHPRYGGVMVDGRTRPPADAPPMLFTFLEQRAVGELGAFLAATPLLRLVGRGDRHPVLVLPGFTASDRSTEVLRWYLRSLGYWTHGWQHGRNYGPNGGRDLGPGHSADRAARAPRAPGVPRRAEPRRDVRAAPGAASAGPGALRHHAGQPVPEPTRRSQRGRAALADEHGPQPTADPPARRRRGRTCCSRCPRRPSTAGPTGS